MTDNVKNEGTEASQGMPVIKLGTKEIKEVLAFSIALGKGIEQSLKDDKFSLSDIPNFMGAFMKLIPAMTGLDEVKLELVAAGPEEVAELKEYVQTELDLDNDSIEELVEASLAVIFDIWNLVNKFFIQKH